MVLLVFGQSGAPTRFIQHLLQLKGFAPSLRRCLASCPVILGAYTDHGRYESIRSYKDQAWYHRWQFKKLTKDIHNYDQSSDLNQLALSHFEDAVKARIDPFMAAFGNVIPNSTEDGIVPIEMLLRTEIYLTSRNYFEAWKYRRDLLDFVFGRPFRPSSLDDDKDDAEREKEECRNADGSLNELCKYELHLTERCIFKPDLPPGTFSFDNTHGNLPWSHRRWILARMKNPEWAHEVQLWQRMQQDEKQKRYANRHRAYIAAYGDVALAEDFMRHTTEEILRDDTSCSPWEHRAVVLQRLHPGLPEEALNKEYKLLCKRLVTNPGNEEAWKFAEQIVKILHGQDRTDAVERFLGLIDIVAISLREKEYEKYGDYREDDADNKLDSVWEVFATRLLLSTATWRLLASRDQDLVMGVVRKMVYNETSRRDDWTKSKKEHIAQRKSRSS